MSFHGYYNRQHANSRRYVPKYISEDISDSDRHYKPNAYGKQSERHYFEDVNDSVHSLDPRKSTYFQEVFIKNEFPNLKVVNLETLVPINQDNLTPILHKYHPDSYVTIKYQYIAIMFKQELIESINFKIDKKRNEIIISGFVKFPNILDLGRKNTRAMKLHSDQEWFGIKPNYPFTNLETSVRTKFCRVLKFEYNIVKPAYLYTQVHEGEFLRIKEHPPYGSWPPNNTQSKLKYVIFAKDEFALRNKN
eukprot:NODE_19_length_47148_cov_1.447810.p25 type:complete len:249 gc:universal NODE_19_length_47148_cov_1.447810:7606-8352(+)